MPRRRSPYNQRIDEVAEPLIESGTDPATARLLARGEVNSQIQEAVRPEPEPEPEPETGGEEPDWRHQSDVGNSRYDRRPRW